MANELNIPSAICHSCFYDENDKLFHIGAANTNYWYALLYLYRKNLLYDNKKHKIFLDNGKKTLNPSFINFSTTIKRKSFNSLGITGNSSYTKLEEFLYDLYHSKLEVNILGKNKLIVSQKIDIITSLYIDKKNIIHITFSDELAKALLHTASYFMKIDLDFLFKLNGYTAKKLYLFVKDYYRTEKREIEIIQRDLELFIDTIPEQKVLDEITKGIEKAKNSDITLTVEKTKNIIVDEFRIKFGDRPIDPPKKLKETETVKAGEDDKNEININDLIEDALNNYIETYPNEIINEDKLRASKKKELLSEKENIECLYSMIKNTIEDYENENDDINIITSNVLYFGSNNTDFYCLDNLYNIHSYRNKTQVTKTPTETVKFIDNLDDINLIIENNEDKKFKLSRLNKGTFFD